MIGSLRGKILQKSDKSVLVEAAGVGYKINVSPETISKIGHQDTDIFLFIHTHVREDTFELYGFMGSDELNFFEMLLGVSGIGPRSALAILGVTTIGTLRRAISSGDTSYLTKISGIGRKTAEKIVIELRDKVGTEEGVSLEGEIDALDALVSLGYSQAEAREALKKVTSAAGTNAKIREALKILGGK